MTLSRESSAVLRGADLDQLPVATLIETRHHSSKAEGSDGGSQGSGVSTEAIDESEDGLAPDEVFAQGYQAGFDEGVATTEATIRETVLVTVDALERAVGCLETERRTWEQVGPAEALTLALQLAELVVMKQVAGSDDAGRDAILRCFSEIEPGEQAVIRLNPHDLASLGPVDDLLIDRSFELVADPAVAAGDAVAVTGSGSIDAKLSTAIERVRQELLP